MRRNSIVSALIVGMVPAVLIVVGCTSKQDSADTGGAVKTSSQGDAGFTGPLFADWPKEGFEGALIISGEQIGYVEPCGCTAGQRGGLARRLDLVQRLRKQGWNLALLDLGSLINDPNTHGGPVETRIRYTYALKALEIMEYDALALSSMDLKLGVGEVLMQYINNLGDKLKIVSANVRPAEEIGLDQRLVPSMTTTAGAVSIGVTAALDPESINSLADPDKDLMLKIQEPGTVLPEVLADLQKNTDIQVLLVQGPPETARRLATENPGFEIVVSTSEFAEPPIDTEQVNDGKTKIISVGKKGQYVAVLGLYKNPELSMRYQRIDLNQRYNSKTEAMRKLIDEDFQDALRQADVLTEYTRRDFVFAGNAPTNAAYTSAEACKSCHPNTYAHWSSTGHAHAYEAMTSNPKRNREADAHCITCHTVGFEFNGGFVNATMTPQFKGVQCENCHGPASNHVAEPDNPVFRAAVARNKDDFDKNGRCTACHTEDDSPHFDFTTYWPKVAHEKLDKYDDPKVHQPGESAKVAGTGNVPAQVAGTENAVH